ncbi:MAG: DUF6452 family protein [Firmicutes bacterium]|nr:DUF6452 family protein [Bacillota bacterium]MCM1401460.1 DUF6452 family protein [Bacteroides sp.]MCM1476818.1 DUF6452 family protein [Bacteroides sp.]
MHKILIPILTVVALALAAGSCNTSGCTDNQNALPLAGFYSSSTGQAISVPDLEIYGQGVPNDSALYNTGAGLSEVYLPFRADKSETTYNFKYLLADSTTVTDKISFTYTSEPYFASEECGAMYYYHIKSLGYTTNLIDSVVILDSLITNVENQRIHIYFRTE